MNLYNLTRRIIADILLYIYREPKVAEKVTRDHLQTLIEAIEPHINELKNEIIKLQKVLAYTYCPTDDEVVWWYKHCNQIDACGGNPPSELDHWVGVAIYRWENRP
jgi:hypothetical protein